MPERFNLAEHLVDRHLREGRADKTAIVCEGRSLTYAELAEQVQRVAGGLRDLGVDSGDRVLLLLPDGPEFIAVFLGCIRIGAVAVPPLWTAEDWANAKIVLPSAKRPVTIRLDGDVIEWFKKQGGGYQTRINAVLKAYVNAQQSRKLKT